MSGPDAIGLVTPVAAAESCSSWRTPARCDCAAPTWITWSSCRRATRRLRGAPAGGAACQRSSFASAGRASDMSDRGSSSRRTRSSTRRPSASQMRRRGRDGASAPRRIAPPRTSSCRRAWQPPSATSTPVAQANERRRSRGTPRSAGAAASGAARGASAGHLGNRAAVAAAVRHRDTAYDDLLMSGVDGRMAASGYAARSRACSTGGAVIDGPSLSPGAIRT